MQPSKFKTWQPINRACMAITGWKRYTCTYMHCKQALTSENDTYKYVTLTTINFIQN